MSQSDMKMFAEYELRSYLIEQDKKIAARIDAFTNDEIMANDIAVLCDLVCEQFRIDPLVILAEDTNRRSIINGKIRKWFDPVRYWTESGQGEWRRVNGITMVFSYPFTGTPFLFRCQASTSMMSGCPELSVEKGYVCITLQFPIEETKDVPVWKDGVEKKIANILDYLQKNVMWINHDLNAWSTGLSRRVHNLLKVKKSGVECFYAAAKSFDISPRINAAGERLITVTKKVIPISHTYRSEEECYCISDRCYDDALSVIKNTASTWEQTPNSYRGMGEEDLRNVLRSSLNASFEGQAAGEAFRHKGKTDICIEEKNRAAFVAECKMWTGEKHVADALAQLDSYTTWRDCKTALIYFVRRKDFLAVLERAEFALKNLSCIHSVRKVDHNEFACQTVSTVTPGRLTEVRVLLFNLQSA